MKYRAEGGGERASAAQHKSARFHGLPDSEIYTTEYVNLINNTSTHLLQNMLVNLKVKVIVVSFFPGTKRLCPPGIAFIM